MAKLSMIEREKKREKLNKKYISKIKMIKEKLKDSKTSDDEAIQLRLKLQKIPLNALSVRKRNRCVETNFTVFEIKCLKQTRFTIFLISFNHFSL